MRLPAGWLLATPEEVASPEKYSLAIGPFGSNLKVADYREAGVPLVFVRNIKSNQFGGEYTKYVSPDKASELKQHSVTPGDLLMTKMGEPPGDVAIYPSDQPDGIITSDCIKLKANPQVVTPTFLKYAFQIPFLKRQIQQQTKGVAQQKLSLERFKTFRLPLAPLEEQRRIVARIEELTARSKTAKQALQAIPPLLEKFRQSVLAAAFRGDLTAEWRRRNPGAQTSALLLERIRNEGRRKSPRRFEHSGPTAKSLPSLPRTWQWSTVEEMSEYVTSGSRGWAEYYANKGAIFLRVGNLDRHDIDLDLEKIVYVSPPANAEGRRTSVEKGDVLLSITADVGMVGLIPEGLGEAYINQHLALIRTLPSVDATCFAYSLCDPNGLQKVIRENQYGATKASLSLVQVRQFPVPVPPELEQLEMVRLIENAFAFSNRVAEATGCATGRAQFMDQSILAKAFRGELVPQNPHEEPACAFPDRPTTQPAPTRTRKPR